MVEAASRAADRHANGRARQALGVTREHRSATGGLHLIFIWDPERPIACGSGALPDGVEVKGQGGYIAVPPSRRKGRAYTVGRELMRSSRRNG
jgi:hypothetical protein